MYALVLLLIGMASVSSFGFQSRPRRKALHVAHSQQAQRKDETTDDPFLVVMTSKLFFVTEASSEDFLEELKESDVANDGKRQMAKVVLKEHPMYEGLSCEAAVIISSGARNQKESFHLFV